METQTGRRFAWHDLESSDPDRVLDFYRDVTGWTPEPFEGGPTRYWMWLRDGDPVGGVGELTDEARAQGARPGWNGYIESADVDADVARVLALGGRVRMAALTLDSVGRMAVVEDPQGAAFTLLAPYATMAPPASDSPVGRFGWCDLHTSDPEGAWAFYRGLLGWEERRPASSERGHRVFGADGDELGGITAAESSSAGPPSWVYHVQVEDLEEAAGRVRTGGGEVVGAIVSVPGGRGVQCRDPEGAAFGLYERATERSVS